MRKAIEDNDPSDGDVSLDNCVIQALTFWWTNSNLPAIWKSDKIKQGFTRMSMLGIYDCIIKRHTTLDPTTIVPHDQQPGPSGHQPPKPNKYVSLESIALKLLSVEYDFLRALSYLVETSEHLYGLSSMTDLPDETYVFTRKEHVHFGLSLKEITSRIAFHILSIWYMSVRDRPHVIPTIKNMFQELELEDDYVGVIDKFPSMVERLKSNKDVPNKIKMGTKSLGKGKNSQGNLDTTASQSNCSSIHPLHSIGENGEESDMEEQVPELVDTSDNKISSTRDNTRDNGQGPTTENENERNENEKNENKNSTHTHRP